MDDGLIIDALNDPLGRYFVGAMIAFAIVLLIRETTKEQP